MSDDSLLASVAADFTVRLRARECPTIDDYAAKHRRSRIEFDFLATLMVVEGLARPKDVGQSEIVTRLTPGEQFGSYRVEREIGRSDRARAGASDRRDRADGAVVPAEPFTAREILDRGRNRPAFSRFLAAPAQPGCTNSAQPSSTALGETGPEGEASMLWPAKRDSRKVRFILDEKTSIHRSGEVHV